MTDQRTIPDFTEPHEGYTNASLRAMLRASHRRERILREALEYCKAMATGGTTSSHRDCIYGKCVRALQEIEEEA